MRLIGSLAGMSSVSMSTCEDNAIMVAWVLLLVFDAFGLHKRGEPRFIGDNNVSNNKSIDC